MVLECLTSNLGAESSGGGSRGNLTGLLDTVVMSSLLAGWLVKPRPDIVLPFLAEMDIRKNSVSLGSHGEICMFRKSNIGYFKSFPAITFLAYKI